jgi:hypothetical protein
LFQHVRDGATAIGELPRLLSHLRSLWGEGHKESSAVIGVCKAVEMVASGILVSLREAGAIAEGLDIRARARTPIIQASSEHSQLGLDEKDYEGFQRAAEMVAKRQQMELLESLGQTSPINKHINHGSAAAPNSFTNGESGIVRR